MDMSGSYRITAPREKVWAALNDPEILKQCIPGCEEIEKHSDTELTAKVVAKVGPVKAKFAGKVTLSDIDPPNGYTITGEGSGGAAGFGKGGAAVKLGPDGEDATLLDYTAHAQVGGKLAQIGSRLIDGTARKMADDFFAKFTQVVGQPQDSAGARPRRRRGRKHRLPAGSSRRSLRRRWRSLRRLPRQFRPKPAGRRSICVWPRWSGPPPSPSWRSCSWWRAAELLPGIVDGAGRHSAAVACG